MWALPRPFLIECSSRTGVGGLWVRFPLPRRNLDGKLEVRKTWMRKMVTHLENIHVARTSGPLHKSKKYINSLEPETSREELQQTEF